MSDFAKQVNTYQPSGNPSIPQVKKFSLSFTTEQQSISLMTGAQNTGNTLSPQTAIVDNTTNTYNVILTVNGINYPVPAGACFTFPLVSFDDPDISVVSAGAGQCVVTLSNQRMPASMLGNSAATESVSVSNFPATQPVSGQVSLLQGTMDLSPTNPIFAQITNQDLVIAPTSASLVSGVVTASGSTTVGTPIANTNLRGLTVSLTGNASQATAGVLTVTLAVNAVKVAVLSFFVPATAGSIISGIEHFRDFSDVSFPVGSAGTLTCELSAALATGVVNINGYFA